MRQFPGGFTSERSGLAGNLKFSGSLTICIIGFLAQDDVIRMILRFDFDAPQLSVAFRVCRVVGEDIAAVDAGENPVVYSRRLSGLFQVFGPSACKIGYTGQGELLA